MTNEKCERNEHEYGEEIHKEVGQGTFTGTTIMPPHKNTVEAVVRQFKRCKHCGHKQYLITNHVSD